MCVKKSHVGDSFMNDCKFCFKVLRTGKGSIRQRADKKTSKKWYTELKKNWNKIPPKLSN